MDTIYIREYTDYLKLKAPVKIELNYCQVAKALYIKVAPQDIVQILSFLRDDGRSNFRQLIDLFGVDYPEREKRFEIIYILQSIKFNHKIYIKVNVAEDEYIPTATSVYENANWYEREAYDLYGVIFDEHPDLRRILTDYGFSGHPLRKDFPLTGHVQVRYDLEKKRVIYEPVKLDQEFRDFDFESPWEGTKYLPGDEKASGDL